MDLLGVGLHLETLPAGVLPESKCWDSPFMAAFHEQLLESGDELKLGGFLSRALHALPHRSHDRPRSSAEVITEQSGGRRDRQRLIHLPSKGGAAGPHPRRCARSERARAKDERACSGVFQSQLELPTLLLTAFHISILVG